MIVLLSSNPRERSAFAALCAAEGWPCTETDSIRGLKKISQYVQPHVLLVRHKLGDGYSDDAIAWLRTGNHKSPPKIIVLLSALASSSLEIRQLALGADCIQRDPVRTDVVAAYLRKYRLSLDRNHAQLVRPAPNAFRFAGGTVDPVEHTLTRRGRSTHVSRREIELSQTLAQPGGLVTYEVLYAEILSRKFQGDTSNLRVLLGKLENSCRQVGIDLRRWIKVIPKLGFQYRLNSASPKTRPPPSRRDRLRLDPLSEDASRP